MYVEQRKNGRWTGRYRDHTGRLRSAGTHDTRAGAEDAAMKAEQSTRERPGAPSLRAYFDEWILAPHVGPSTRLSYRSTYRNHIDKHIGRIAVDDIMPNDIRRVLDPLIDEDRLHLAKKCRTVMSSVFRSLVDEGVVAISPVPGIRVTSAAAAPPAPLEPEDFKAIVSELPSDETKLFARFLVSSGLRYGEAAALRVHDLDIRTREVRVQRGLVAVNTSMSEDGGMFMEHDALSPSRRRSVQLSEAMMQKIVEHIDRHCLGNDDLLFGRAQMTGNAANTNPGNQYLRWKWWNDTWVEAVREVGLPWTPQTDDLRHTHASLEHRHWTAELRAKAAAAADIFL